MKVGLTGGIGSGKSTVLLMLARRGAAAIDADAISRATTATGGSAMAAIAARFGPTFLAPDGSLDRDRMRAHVYARPQDRRDLEAIIHPLVAAESARQVQSAQDAGARCIVFDVPLLVESGRWRNLVNRVLVVDCLPATQVRRVTARSGLTASEVEAIMAAQAPRPVRLAAADVVIFNDELSLAELEAEVGRIAQSFRL